MPALFLWLLTGFHANFILQTRNVLPGVGNRDCWEMPRGGANSPLGVSMRVFLESVALDCEDTNLEMV